MGLTLVEALENLLARVDTPGVACSRARSPGRDDGRLDRPDHAQPRDRAAEASEGRGRGAAQKAPVKILFPILFLIMPALFIVLLLPVMITVMDVLG
jgi:tight adherence protein C